MNQNVMGVRAIGIRFMPSGGTGITEFVALVSPVIFFGTTPGCPRGEVPIREI